MRKVDENRAENYIKKHSRYKKWLAFAMCISLLTGTVTLYILNKPATAMTADVAEGLGIVVDTADSEFEAELIRQMEEGELNNENNNTQEVVNTDENATDNDSEVVVANSDDTEETAKETSDDTAESTKDNSLEGASEDSSDAATSASSDKSDAAASLDSVKESNSEAVKEITLTATLIDEFGKEIDPSKYSDIKLPEFDSVLVLDDIENPPYEDVKIKTGTLKTTAYNYVKAVVGNKVITGIKKETVIVTTSDESTSESAAEESAADDKTKEVTVYSYTIDGSEYTRFEEDTVINFVYSMGTQSEYVYTDDDVNITAKLQVPGAIPDDAELVVTKITNKTEGYNYDAYLEALNENAESIASDAGQDVVSAYSEDNTLMYDIAFMYEGQEVEPAEGAVSISIEFKEKQLSNELSVSSEEEVAVVHLPIKTEVKEASEITSTQEATDISAADIEVNTLTDATCEVNETEKIEYSVDSFSVFAVIAYQDHKAGTDTFETVLGDAVNFGMVSNYLDIRESQTNFATMNLVAQVQSGNDLTNKMEQTFIAATIKGNFKVKGYDAYFITPKEFQEQVSHESGAVHIKFDSGYSINDLFKIVGDMMDYIRAASKDLASRTDNASLKKVGDKYVVDTTSYGEGTYYVTLNADAINNIGEAGKLIIRKNSNQTIVFNVTAEGEIWRREFYVSTDGGEDIYSPTLESSSKYNYITQSLIWNYINATSVHAAGSQVGVMIAGNKDAFWHNETTGAGWLAFPGIIISSGEWHNTYTNVKQISGTAQFQAYKMVDDKPSTVDGFKFSLFKKDDSEAGWKYIQTVTNDSDSPYNVVFEPITYGGSTGNTQATYQYTSIKNVGESETFVYAILESQGTTDTNGKAYNPDYTYYYAKVTVTIEKQNNHTASTFYRVSDPEYFLDEECTQPVTENGGIPTFKNTTEKGRIGIALKKYLNGADPGELKFSFTVRYLDYNGQLQNLTSNLTNDGSNIAFGLDYDWTYITKVGSKNGDVPNIFLVITENDITSKTGGVTTKKDRDYIIVRIVNPGKEDQQILYLKYKAASEDGKERNDQETIDKIENSTDCKKEILNATTGGQREKHVISDPSQIAFYNTGGGDLRIHKMVVNDFGSGFVRDNTGTALLSNVKFRITNNSTGDYIVFTGFTGHAGDEGKAIEYNTSHQETGNTYRVEYNQSAQWTIIGIPAGTYTVDEVADGLTFTYDPSTNTSSVIEESNLSRVTKYDVTVDEESGSKSYGYGGQNLRAVFSVDIPNHLDQGPNYVKVGSTEVGNTTHTPTVQVCNYYSIPIGPIQVTKNFAGGEWTKDMAFTFKIEAAGYSAYTSEGAGISLAAQPMPTVTTKTGTKTYETHIQDTVTLTGDDATYVNGKYTAVAQFASIPFKFEGTYYYKITETDTGIDSVNYDKTVYYVKIVVSKKYTKFSKKYTYDNMSNPAKYKSDTTLDEDFYYLGADVIYASDENFSNVLATCELHLGNSPDTDNPENNEFIVTYSEGDVSKVAFNNTLSGNLFVSKVWLDAEGKENPEGHTNLTLYIWQRLENSSNWIVYGSVTLSGENKWQQQVTDLPITDENGTKYVYTVKETDDYVATYSVRYTYNGVEYNANAQGNISVYDKNTGVQNTKDTGYVMTLGSDNKSYGSVKVTNRAFNTNILPSTGGIGDTPFKMFGLLFILFALLGGAFTYINKNKINKIQKEKTMKGFKKLIMGLLVTIMVLGASITAFAADGSITVTNARKGQIYNAYRVFDFVVAQENGTSEDGKFNGGVYKLAEKFSGFTSTYFSVGDNDILDVSAIKTETDAAAFGQEVLTYAKANNIKPDATQTADGDEDTQQVVMAGLEYGYYVIDSSLGAVVTVDTTAPYAKVEDKQDVPNLDKTVKENSTGEVNLSENSAQIGETVEFTITADLKANGENYEIVDKMTKGLTLVEDSFAYSFSNGEVAHDAPVVTKNEDGTTSFSIKFTAVPTNDTVCTVTYKAVLNTDAEIYTGTNVNEAYLKYGNNSETTHKTTETYTYPLKLVKLDGETSVQLAGAEFEVIKKADGSVVKFTVVDEHTYKVDPAGTVETVVTKADAATMILGLDDETYILHEIKAPAGYNLLTTTEKDANGTEYQHSQAVTVLNTSTLTTPTEATVLDYTGSLLPSTGGIGTRIFYIVGGVLIVAAIAFFMIRRKADAE